MNAVPFAHEFFVKHEYKTFEILYVLDINQKEDPHYFLVIVENVKTKQIDVLQLTPEMLRSKYRPGYFYKKDKRARLGNRLDRMIVDITTNHDDQLVKLESLFEPSDLLIEKKTYYTNFLMRQYAYRVDLDEHILVIPCYAIALRYYFLSSSMRQAVMAGSLSDLSYKGLLIGHDEVYMELKTKAGQKDIPFIGRFLTNSYAMYRFKYFFSQSSYSKRELGPIKAYFPVNDTFKIIVNYKEIHSSKLNKPVFYVTSIVNDTSPLGFSKITYKKYSTKTNPDAVIPEVVNLPKTGKFKKRKPLLVNRTITGKKPNKDNDAILLFEQTDRDLNTIDLIIESQKEYLGTSPVEAEKEHVDQVISGSFESGSSTGDTNVAPVSSGETDNDKEMITLDHFLLYYEELIVQYGVEEAIPICSYEIRKMHNKKNTNTYNSWSLVFPDETRYFLFSVFYYDELCVYLLEIQHDYSWTPSTWLFVSDSSEILYDAEDFKHLLETFIENKMTYSELTELANATYNLKFIPHKHRHEDDPEVIEKWCVSLLNKIFDLV